MAEELDNEVITVEVMAEELDYRRVLRKCIFSLKEDLEPDSILDEFTASDYLTPIAIRDIRETSTTTKKNEAIVNNVLTKGIKGYKKFKRFLRNTYQGHLADVLEEMEKKVQKDQKSKSGPNLGGQDVRGSQYDPGRLTAHNYGGQYWQNMSAAGNRSNPSSGQNNPLMAARHLPRDQSATGIGSRNVGGDNAFNVYGGHVNVQGNMIFGGGHPETYDRNQSGYQATYDKSHIWNYQNQQPEQLHIQGRVQQPQMQPHSEFSTLKSFRQTQAQSTSVQHIGNAPTEEDHTTLTVQPGENMPYDKLQGSNQDQIKDIQRSEQRPPVHLIGQTPTQFTFQEHVGNVPVANDQKTQTAQLDASLQDRRLQDSNHQDQTKDIQRSEQRPPVHLIGQTPTQFTFQEHVGNVRVANDQKTQTAQLDANLQDRRLQDSNHQNQTKVFSRSQSATEGEQQREERGPYDETDARRLEDNTNEDDTETSAHELPSVSRQVFMEKPQDVDDGRVLDVPLKWLNSVLEKEPFSSGNSGDIFKSKEIIREWNMKIAVKKIQRTKYSSRAAQNEVIAARLRHHAIVPLLGRCLEDHLNYYFVFPYMENGNLRDAIKEDMNNENLKMDAMKRVFILYKVSCAILYIHSEVQDLRQKMVHGDITTTNIVLDRNYNPRLLDFGVARSLKDEDFVTLGHGDQIGAYTTRVVDKKLSLETDYRSFGVVILEMLTAGNDPKQLKKPRVLKALERAYGACREKVWTHNMTTYWELRELAEKCLKGEVNAGQIAKALCNILNETFSYEWQIPKDEKCSMCMINPAEKAVKGSRTVDPCVQLVVGCDWVMEE